MKKIYDLVYVNPYVVQVYLFRTAAERVLLSDELSLNRLWHMIKCGAANVPLIKKRNHEIPKGK